MAAPEFSELIAAAVEARVAEARVTLPGKVLSYDAGTRTCKVQPLVKKPVEGADGVITFEAFAPIDNVPVVFPGAASLSLYFALASGDIVQLVFNDFSPAIWRQTGNMGDAQDIQAHGPSYPVALPYYRPGGKGGSEPDESIGKPNGLRLHFHDAAIAAGEGSAFVANATLVDAALNALKAAISAAATAEGMAGGLGGMTALSTALATAWPPPPGTASTNLKAD